jgi:carboxyl-terminal processing protease
MAENTPRPAYPTIGNKVDDILKALNENYVEQLDMTELSQKIYQEVAAVLGDPYTNYLDAQQYEAFMEDTEGIYAGIGVMVGANLDTNRIVITVPFEGYPSAEAGLLPGDAIIKVNGYDVNAEMMDETVRMIKGEQGTSVELTIYRESSDETFDVTIIREIINVPTVSHKMLEGDIGYLRITQFERVTAHQFEASYNELVGDGMKGLILDLRNNPGGLLSVVNYITDILVPEGIIVYTEDRYGNQTKTPSNEEHIEVPLLVLVNGNSASASEVLSGAVRDHGVGELVGTTTFGKGLVQNIYTLKDNSALRITIAKYYTPSGVCIQDIGLEPDFEIDMDAELTVRLSTLTLDEDVQLKKAMEVMEEKLGTAQ